MNATANENGSDYAALLLGIAPRTPPDPATLTAWAALAQRDRTTALLEHRLSALGLPRPPEPARAALRAVWRASVARQLARDAAIMRLLEGLPPELDSPLIIKGAALAHTLYPDPCTRACGDVDLLAPEATVTRLAERLEAQGYRRGPPSAHRGMARAIGFTSSATNVAFDLHWGISHRQALARALPYDEAAREAVALPALGPHARTLSPPHALLLACLHYAAHRPAERRGVWLLDVALLLRSMDAEQQATFIARARASPALYP